MPENNTKRTAVIIEDEQPIRNGFKEILALYCPEVVVIGEAEGVTAGIQLLNAISPDILFLDIMLGDGMGFEILDKVDNLTSNLIFVTSHNNYALKAFQYNAINYLLKPIDPDDLIKTIQRLPPKQNEQFLKKQVSLFSESYQKGNFQQLTISTREGLFFVPLEDIMKMESDENLVTFYLQTGKKMVSTTKSLKDYINLLPKTDFYRPHRSHIVQRKYISSFIFEDGGYILMSDQTSVSVSRRKKDDFLKWLKS